MSSPRVPPFRHCRDRPQVGPGCVLPPGDRHRTSRHLNSRTEQDHRGCKECERPLRGFGCPSSTVRFCCSYDELRHRLRPRSRPHQHVYIDRRRMQFFRRSTAALAILNAALRGVRGRPPHQHRSSTERLRGDYAGKPGGSKKAV